MDAPTEGAADESEPQLRTDFDSSVAFLLTDKFQSDRIEVLGDLAPRTLHPAERNGSFCGGHDQSVQAVPDHDAAFSVDGTNSCFLLVVTDAFGPFEHATTERSGERMRPLCVRLDLHDDYRAEA